MPRRQRMPGDASTRSYARLIKGDQSTILMNSPRRPDGPALYDGKSYSEAVHLAEDVKPFVAIANGLRERGYSAPAIHHADLDDGFLITEDFGRDLFIEGDPPKPIVARYQVAVDMLAAFHQEPLPDVLPLAPHLDYIVPPFDNDAMMVEVGLMPEWYLPDKGVTLTSNMQADFLLIWQDLFSKLAGAPRTWMLRDFHSPNLIWLEHRKDTGRVGLLDFQDGVMGPAAYDLVSLLQGRPDRRPGKHRDRDARALCQGAADRRRSVRPGCFRAAIRHHVRARNTRLLGTFARLNRRDGKPQYLRHQPRVWTYLNRALAHPSLETFREWCIAYVPAP